MSISDPPRTGSGRLPDDPDATMLRPIVQDAPDAPTTDAGHAGSDPATTSSPWNLLTPLAASADIAEPDAAPAVETNTTTHLATPGATSWAFGPETGGAETDAVPTAPTPVPTTSAPDQQPPVIGATDRARSAGASAWEATGAPAAPVALVPSQWGSPLPALLGGLGALLAGYVLSLLLLLLGWAGVGLVSDNGTSQLDGAASDVGLQDLGGAASIVVRLAVHLMNLSLGSRLAINGQLSGVGGTVRVAFPNLFLILAFVVAAYWGTRLLARRWQQGTPLGAVAMAALSGLATATMATVIGRVTAFSAFEDGVSVTAHSASFLGFLGCAVLCGGATWLGATHAAGRATFGMHPLARDIVRALVTFAGHVLLVGTVVLTIGAIAFFFKVGSSDGFGRAFGGLLILVPILGGILGAWLFGQSSLGAVSGGGSGASELTSRIPVTMQRSMTMFVYPWWATLALVVVALACLVVAGCWWASHRRVGRVSQRAELFAWSVLPCVYLFGGLVLLVVARVGLSGSGSGPDSGVVSGSIGLHLTAWTPLVIALLGLLVDLVARFLSPVLLPYLPASAQRVLRWEPTPRAAVAGQPGAPVTVDAIGATDPTATLSSGQPVGPGAVAGAPTPAGMSAPAGMSTTAGATAAGASPVVASAQGMAAPIEQRPMSPEARRRWRRIGIAAAVVVGVLVALLIAVKVLDATVFTARNAAKGVLAEVASGDAGAAARDLGDAAPQGNQSLLTKGVYSATRNRVTDYSISSVDTHAGQATVHTLTKQNCGVGSIDMVLTRRGHRYGLFDKWVVTSMPVAHVDLQVPQGATKVTVNGTDLDITGLADQATNTVSLPAFPGTYTVKLPDQGKYLSGTQSDVVVGWQDAAQPTEMTVSLNDTFTKELDAAVKAKIDSCAAATGVTIDDSCPWSTYIPSEATAMSWRVTSYPTITVTSGSADDGYSFYTTKPGSVTGTYKYNDSDTGAPKAEALSPVDINSQGSVTIDGDKLTVVFGS